MIYVFLIGFLYVILVKKKIWSEYYIRSEHAPTVALIKFGFDLENTLFTEYNQFFTICSVRMRLYQGCWRDI